MKLKPLIFGAIVLGSASAAHALDGCKILLCLAASNGTPEQCKPDLKQLWKDLAKGRPFPTCDFSRADEVRPILANIIANPEVPPETRSSMQAFSDNMKDSYARQGYDYYDPCPEGTKALTEGTYALQGDASLVNKFRFGRNYGLNNTPIYTGIGDGANVQNQGYDYGGLPAKICVGNFLGNTSAYVNGNNHRASSVGVYDRVVGMDAAASPRIIDVYINDALTRRVRW